MKLAPLSLSICLVVSGCLKPVPPPPEVPQVVVVMQVTPPPAPEILPEVDASVVRTWMSEEEAKAEARKRGECVCDRGDPLCSCDDPQLDND